MSRFAESTPPVDLYPVFEKLENEWESTTCAVCGADKWANHPFCRRCSIRLQRARLMRLLRVFRGHNVCRLLRDEAVARLWIRRYDACRDYLITARAAA